jgi:hypothetical protein
MPSSAPIGACTKIIKTRGAFLSNEVAKKRIYLFVHEHWRQLEAAIILRSSKFNIKRGMSVVISDIQKTVWSSR